MQGLTRSMEPLSLRLSCPWANHLEGQRVAIEAAPLWNICADSVLGEARGTKVGHWPLLKEGLDPTCPPGAVVHAAGDVREKMY